MKTKLFYTTVISTDLHQDIKIQPAEAGDCVLFSFKESGDAEFNRPLIMDEVILEGVIAKLREMMEHLKH
jgi:hypothetical protein